MSVSLGTMVKQIDGLTSSDVSEWEAQFIENIVARTKCGDDTRGLSEKQAETVLNIWRKHFA